MADNGPEEGTHERLQRERRVHFWFLCSALGGVCARELFPNSPEQVVQMSYRIAELMTEEWIKRYDNADVGRDQAAD